MNKTNCNLKFVSYSLSYHVLYFHPTKTRYSSLRIVSIIILCYLLSVVAFVVALSINPNPNE